MVHDQASIGPVGQNTSQTENTDEEILQNEELVREWEEESFPASDPPANF